MAKRRLNRLRHSWDVISDASLVKTCLSLRVARSVVTQLKKANPQAEIFVFYNRQVLCKVEGAEDLYKAH